MRPTVAAVGPPHTSREFSADVIDALLRGLLARAVEHPESPGLIASSPGVPEARMAAACSELRRQGHAVCRVAIARPGGDTHSGWALGGTTYRAGSDVNDRPAA